MYYHSVLRVFNLFHVLKHTCQCTKIPFQLVWVTGAVLWSMEMHLPWVMTSDFFLMLMLYRCSECSFFVWICNMLFRVLFVKNKHLNISNNPIRSGSWYYFLLKKKTQKMVVGFVHCLWSETKILHRCVTWFRLCSMSGPRGSTAVRNAVCHEVRGTAPFSSTNPWVLHCTNPNLFCCYSLLYLSQLTGSAQQKLSKGHVRKSLSENARTDQFCACV